MTIIQNLLEADKKYENFFDYDNVVWKSNYHS